MGKIPAESSVLRKCDRHFNVSISLSKERKEMLQTVDVTLSSLSTPHKHKDCLSKMGEALQRFREINESKNLW